MMNLKTPINAIRKAFGYHAIVDKGRRQAPISSTYHEDDIMSRSERRKLIATAQDASRNFVLLEWMIRKHLDYVSSFHFQPRTKDKEFARRLNLLVDDYSMKQNCDAAKRHPLRRLIRILEQVHTLQGDGGFIKRQDGKLQLIEGDRVIKPTSATKELENVTDLGLVLDDAGATLKYCVCKRDGSQLLFDRLIKAENMIWDGYFGRYDQTRGISPIASALNTLKDLYEASDYNLVKAKYHAMFGMAIMYEAESTGPAFPLVDVDSDNVPNAAAGTIPGFKLQPGLKLELPSNAKIDTIESRTPSNEYQQFTELMIRIAILALDLPFSAFDSSGATFATKLADMNDYLKSANEKRQKNRDILYEITDWKLQSWVANGDLILPKGMTLDEVDYEWVPTGTNWIDPGAQVQATRDAIKSGLTSRQRDCRARGEDAFQIMDELADEEAYASVAGTNGTGCTLEITTPGAESNVDAQIQKDAADNPPPDETENNDEEDTDDAQ